MRDLHEQNRHSWNAATRQHNIHKGDQAAFLRGGGSTLFPEEVELLGDVHGQSLVHVQCNAGQDTLSIAGRLGAAVTGIDISDEAITFAQRLSSESGIPGEFIRADVYDWFETNTRQFDVAFSSYGALCWLSDLSAWGRGVAAALKPGGCFVLVEFHPLLGVLDGALSGDWSKAEDYMGGRHHAFAFGVGDYVAMSGGGLTPDGTPITEGADWKNPNPAHEFAWGLADVLTALLDAGLTLTAVREYPYCNGFVPYPGRMVEGPGRRMTFGEGMPKLPLMYAVRAEKPASP
jgi:SAM-dependent methyltransferase